MGARGNSGLSLLSSSVASLRLSKEKDELTGQTWLLPSISEVAYKAVMKPVEGTILTVSRGAANDRKAETNDAI